MTPSRARRLLLRYRTPAQFFFGNAPHVGILFVKMVQDQDNTSRKNRVVKDQSDCPFVMQLEIIHHAGQEHLKSRSPPVALLETQVVHWRHGRKG